MLSEGRGSNPRLRGLRHGASPESEQSQTDTWSSRKQRYALEEAHSRLNEAKQNYRESEQQAIYQVKDQYLSVQSSERILKLYTTTLLPQAQ